MNNLTPEDKRNAGDPDTPKRGITRAVVLEGENHAIYDELKTRYMTTFDPRDQFEHDLVTDMVQARWRIRRVKTMENALLANRIGEILLELRKHKRKIGNLLIEALALQSLTNTGRSLELLGRFEARYFRIYEKARRMFDNHRNQRQSG